MNSVIEKIFLPNSLFDDPLQQPLYALLNCVAWCYHCCRWYAVC